MSYLALHHITTDVVTADVRYTHSVILTFGLMSYRFKIVIANLCLTVLITDAFGLNKLPPFNISSIM